MLRGCMKFQVIIIFKHKIGKPDRNRARGRGWEEETESPTTWVVLYGSLYSIQAQQRLSKNKAWGNQRFWIHLDYDAGLNTLGIQTRWWKQDRCSSARVHAWFGHVARGEDTGTYGSYACAQMCSWLVTTAEGEHTTKAVLTESEVGESCVVKIIHYGNSSR